MENISTWVSDHGIGRGGSIIEKFGDGSDDTAAAYEPSIDSFHCARRRDIETPQATASRTEHRSTALRYRIVREIHSN